MGKLSTALGRIIEHAQTRVWMPPRTIEGVIAGVLAGSGAIAVASPGSFFWFLGWAAIAASVIVALRLVRVNGRHLWEPWWRGAEFPLLLDIRVLPFEYEIGADVHGIKWAEGFSHIHARLTNRLNERLSDVTVLFTPERPMAIIQSRARCEFADCRIGLSVAMPQSTIVVRSPDGRRTAVPPSETYRLMWGPPHRLVCDSLPAGVTVDVDFATVRGLEDKKPEDGLPWHSQRCDPRYIDVLVKCVWNGMPAALIERLPLTKGTANESE